MNDYLSLGKITIGVDCRFIQDKFHGIGRYTYKLLTSLSSLEGSHRVIAFVDPSLPNSRFPINKLAQSDNIEIRTISIPLYHPRELWSWYAELRQSPVDVFHSPYFWSPMLLPCPLITTIHDMIYDRYPNYIPARRFALVYKVTSRLALKKSRRVIAISEATRSDIIHFTNTERKKIVVVQPSVDAWFTPIHDERTRQDVRQRYGLPSTYILAVGARRPHKNIGRLIASFSRIAANIPHALVLVGSIDKRFPIEAADDIIRLKREGRILEIAEVAESDMPTLYSMADLFVQPSIIEGFGLPVLEAMACGCPVACSNTTSLPEVAGNAAMYFDPLSEVEIDKSIRETVLSPDLLRDLAQRGLRRAAQFSRRTEAQRTLEVYISAVSNGQLLYKPKV